MRLLARIANAIRWHQAIEISTAGEPQAALAKLNLVDVENIGVPRREVLLLKSYLLMSLNDPTTKMVLAEAMNSIDQSDGIDLYERAYLKKYAEWLLASVFSIQSAAELTYDDVELSGVSNRLKRFFPLPNHPAWIK